MNIRQWRSVSPTQSTVTVAILLVAGTLCLLGRAVSPIRSQPPERNAAETSRNVEALWECEQSLASAHRRVRLRPDAGAAWLRVATLEMQRANLLALRAGVAESSTSDGLDEPAESNATARRHAFLRTDPEQSVSNAVVAAERAIRLDLDRESRRDASLLLARARSLRGDHTGAVAALANAARREPEDAQLWLLLCGACRRAGQFTRAEAALKRASTCIDHERSTP